MPIKLSALNAMSAEIDAIASARAAIKDSVEGHAVTFKTPPNGLTVVLPAEAVQELLLAISHAKITVFKNTGVTLD